MKNQKYFMVAGLALLFAVILVTYYSAFKIGYYFNEDYELVLDLHKMDLSQALHYFFEPTLQWRWYRPIYGMVVWLINSPLGANPTLYHIPSIVGHIGSSVLVWLLIWRVARYARIGFLAALIFSVLPSYDASVWWPLDSAPVSAFFALLTLGFWFEFRKQSKGIYYWGALGSYILALLTKEISIVLLPILILFDWLLVLNDNNIRRTLALYTSFGLGLLGYLLIEWSFQSHRAVIGYSMDVNILQRLLAYASLFLAPWHIGAFPIFWGGAIILYLLFLARVRRRRELILLGCATLLSLIPVLPVQSIEMRYWYAPSIPLSILAAGFILDVQKKLAPYLPTSLLVTSLIALFMGQSSVLTNQRVEEIAGAARQARATFRPIAQKYSVLVPDTLLYFIDPPIPTVNLAGMSLLQYGDQAIVGGSDIAQPARLRDHRNTLVIYHDEDGVHREQPVNPRQTSMTKHALPVQYAAPIQLLDYEVANGQVHPGEDIILLLYWQGTAKIDRDYTVFVHLVDDAGNVLSGVDHQPGDGRKPTSSWQPENLVVDWAIIPLDTDVPVGKNYQLDLGLYYLPTMERVPILNAGAEDSASAVVIQRLEIVP